MIRVGFRIPNSAFRGYIRLPSHYLSATFPSKLVLIDESRKWGHGLSYYSSICRALHVLFPRSILRSLSSGTTVSPTAMEAFMPIQLFRESSHMMPDDQNEWASRRAVSNRCNVAQTLEWAVFPGCCIRYCPSTSGQGFSKLASQQIYITTQCSCWAGGERWDSLDRMT